MNDFEYDEKEPRLRLRIHPVRGRFWIAHTPPYTLTDLASLRKALLRHPDVHEQEIGKSVEGRDLLLWTIGNANAKTTVWLMFRQHAWESGSSWTGDGAVRALLHDTEAAHRRPVESSPDGRSGRRGEGRSPLQP